MACKLFRRPRLSKETKAPATGRGQVAGALSNRTEENAHEKVYAVSPAKTAPVRPKKDTPGTAPLKRPFCDPMCFVRLKVFACAALWGADRSKFGGGENFRVPAWLLGLARPDRRPGSDRDQHQRMRRPKRRSNRFYESAGHRTLRAQAQVPSLLLRRQRKANATPSATMLDSASVD